MEVSWNACRQSKVNHIPPSFKTSVYLALRGGLHNLIKAMAKKNKTTKKENKEMAIDAKAKVMGFGDQIDFIQIFRVKGRQGLFTLRSAVHKSGTVAVIGFLDYNRKFTVLAEQLECLGSLIFTTLAGNEDIKINTVFNNLHQYEIDNGDTNFDKMDVEQLMPLMVPEFDPDHFKDYHAKKVVMWYSEVINKLKELELEEPTE